MGSNQGLDAQHGVYWLLDGFVLFVNTPEDPPRDYDDETASVIYVVLVFVVWVWAFTAYTKAKPKELPIHRCLRTTRCNERAVQLDTLSQLTLCSMAAVVCVLTSAVLCLDYSGNIHKQRSAEATKVFFRDAYDRVLVHEFDMVEISCRLVLSWLVYDNRVHRELLKFTCAWYGLFTRGDEFQSSWCQEIRHGRWVFLIVYVMKSVLVGFVLWPMLEVVWSTLAGKVFCLLFALFHEAVLSSVNAVNVVLGMPGWVLRKVAPASLAGLVFLQIAPASLVGDVKRLSAVFGV